MISGSVKGNDMKQVSFYLAPMEGITTYVYRNAFKKYYGGVEKYFTPFLTASHLKGRELRDVHPDNNRDMHTVPQILTNDPELFLTIARQLGDLGYREINLNLGCPSGTVVSKGRGSGFLARTEELDRFLYEIYAGISEDMKISVKTRIGFEFESEWEDILEIYKKYPISELIIHPRLREDYYTGKIRMETYRRAKEVLGDKLPLCYNGDITDETSFREKLGEAGIMEDTCTSAVMIGRGIIMNPEMLKSLGQDEESQGGIDRVKLRHFLHEITENYITEMSGEKQVVMKMKELWTFLGMGLKLDKRDMKEIHKVKSLAEYRSAEQMVLLKK